MISNQTLFEDKFCRLANDRIIIKCYYFPFGCSKTIFLSDVTKVEYNDLGCERGRAWGMDAARCGYWYALDCCRLCKQKYLAVHLKGQWIVPSFSSTNYQQLYHLLQQQVNAARQQMVADGFLAQQLQF